MIPGIVAWRRRGAVDPYFENVSLLLRMDGANGSTVFTDSSPRPKTVTSQAGAVISTAQSRFGGSSALITGGAHLTSPVDADFGFEEGDFTIEAWVYIPGAISGNYAAIVDIRNTPSGGYSLLFMTDSNRRLGYYGQGEQRSTAQIPLAQWSHVAVSRSAPLGRFFIDGLLVFEHFNMGVIKQNQCYIGRVYDNAHPPFSGFIDELRITKGVARYTENFTPPTEPFPDQ